MLTRRAAAILVALGVLAAGCSGQPSASEAPSRSPLPPAPVTPFVVPTSPSPTPTVDPLLPFKRQKLSWEGCGDNECADLEVPLDYSRPDGDTLQIALVRNRANDRDERIGALVINPGGPGGSGVDYVASGDGIVTPSIADRFDLIGFDPRGVSRSAPLRCLSSEEADRFYAFDGSPDTDAESTGALLLGRRFATLCEREGKDVLPFLGTRDAARDLDILRAALDEEKLNFLGKSYGTYLGAEYLRQFPENAGRLVLDGAVDPALDADNFARGQATGFQRALEAFLADCVRRSDCPLGRDRDTAEERLAEFLDNLDARPLAVGDRELTQALATLGVLASFYSKRSWPRLFNALGEGLKGDGSGLLELADFYSDRNPDGTYGDNGLDAFYGIACMDRDDPKDVDETAALASALTQDVSKIFGAYLAWGNTPCQSWPLEPTLPGEPVVAPGVGPIVVVGTTRDPATPYEWSQALADQLDQGRLITFDGDGHTAYGGASRCVDDAVDAYLISGDDPGDLDCP